MFLFTALAPLTFGLGGKTVFSTTTISNLLALLAGGIKKPTLKIRLTQFIGWGLFCASGFRQKGRTIVRARRNNQKQKS
jgi:hypothetical protein